MITADFIRKWQASYDSEAHDEIEYRHLADCLRKEIAEGRINFETIVRAVEWKTARIKGKMDFGRPDKYCSTVKLAYDTDDQRRKLRLLISLDGWGVPMASTMLHFLHPDSFPIIDYRVLEVLRTENGFVASRDTEKGYWLYYEEIHRIMKVTGLAIREIDRALWAAFDGSTAKTGGGQ